MLNKDIIRRLKKGMTDPLPEGDHYIQIPNTYLQHIITKCEHERRIAIDIISEISYLLESNPSAAKKRINKYWSENIFLWD